LLSTSTDEEIARNFILFGQPDVTVIVTDATRLERNLNLVLQVLEITDRAVVCVNLMDEARRHGLEINIRALSKELGVPVVPTEARQKVGVTELLSAIDDVITGKFKCRPRRVENINNDVEKAVNELTKSLLHEFPNLPNARWVALRLLEGDQSIADAVNYGTLGDLKVENRELQESNV
jgi:ferrous iron transport protein B